MLALPRARSGQLLKAPRSQRFRFPRTTCLTHALCWLIGIHRTTWNDNCDPLFSMAAFPPG